MPTERSNLVAGVLTLAAVTAFAGAIWAWKSWDRARQVTYVVHFTAMQGVYGLREGSAVLVGGLRRGAVEGIAPIVADGQVTGYDVSIRLQREVPVYRGARFEASAAGINGEAALEIRELGRFKPIRGAVPQPDESGLLPPGTRVAASDPAPFRTAFGASAARPVGDLMDAWFPDPPSEDALPGRLERTFTDVKRRWAPLNATADELRGAARADFAQWRPRFDEARTAASAAFARLGSGTDPAPDALVPQVRAIRTDLESLPDLGLGRATAAADAFDAAVASVRALGARSGELRAMLTDEETSIGASNADFSIAAQELSATETEAVLAPWNLLASPGKAQLDAEARIAVARAYAEAAAEHQRAMKGIEDALRRDGDLLAREPGLAGLLQARLDAANALFRSQADRMESLLIGAPAPAPAGTRRPR